MTQIVRIMMHIYITHALRQSCSKKHAAHLPIVLNTLEKIITHLCLSVELKIIYGCIGINGYHITYIGNNCIDF